MTVFLGFARTPDGVLAVFDIGRACPAYYLGRSHGEAFALGVASLAGRPAWRPDPRFVELF